MPPPFSFRFFRLLAAFLCCALVAGGCSYKSEIRQGNDSLPDRLGDLRVGMSRNEVLALLGPNRTPVVFVQDSWIYYYQRRVPGFYPQTEALGVELIFADEQLSEIRPLTPEQ